MTQIFAFLIFSSVQRSKPEKASIEVDVTYLQFQFSSAFPPRGWIWFSFTFSRKRNTFVSSCDLELWPVTLTYKVDLDRISMTHRAKYRHPRWFRSIVRTHTQTHTHQADCSTWATKYWYWYWYFIKTYATNVRKYDSTMTVTHNSSTLQH